jgi:hypothetical protein
MAEALRLFFLAVYALGVTMLMLRVLPLAVRSAPAELHAATAPRIASGRYRARQGCIGRSSAPSLFNAYTQPSVEQVPT